MRMFRMCIIGIGIEGGLRDRVLVALGNVLHLSLIHISEPTRPY